MLVIRTIRPQETPSSSEAKDDVAGHLEGCVQGGLSREERAKLNCKAALLDCDQALDLESENVKARYRKAQACLLYTSPSPRDRTRSRMPSSA